MRDLFQPDDGGWLKNVGLIDSLVAEKLKADAEKIAAGTLSRVMKKGVPVSLACAGGGLLWSILVGLSAGWLQHRAGSVSSDVVLFCCIVDGGILAGSGLL